MQHQPDALHPGGAGRSVHAHRPVQRNTDSTADIAALRPFRAVLCARDYWQMQEHRRRCEELGGAGFLRLARLIRARSSAAQIVDRDELPDNVATGAALITFAFGRHRPETRQLYHWDYPVQGHGLPVASFLGITLIGMSAGQRAPLIDGDGVVGEVQVSAVHAQAAHDWALCA